MEHLAVLELLDHKASKVHRDNLDQLDNVENLDFEEKQAREVHLVPLATQVPLDNQDLKGREENLDHLELMDNQDHKDNEVFQERLVHPVRLVSEVNRAHKVHLDPMDNLEGPARGVNQVPLVILANKDQQVLVVKPDREERTDNLDNLVAMDKLDLLVQEENRVHRYVISLFRNCLIV